MAKAVNNNPWGIKMIPYERAIVDFIEALLDVAHRNNSRDYIQHEKDWQTMEFMYRGWSILYPKSAKEFENEIKTLRSMQRGRHAIAKDKGGAIMQHKLKVPRPFFDMMTTIWRNQVFDERFVNQFARRFPAFKVTNDQL